MTTTTMAAQPWLAHYDEGVPHKIDYRQITLPQILEANISNYPERTALNFMGFQLSYTEFGEMIDRFAAALAGFGITKGDRVAILLPNTIPCVVAYHATLKLGAVVVMNNPLYTDRELIHQLNDSGAICLVTLDLMADRMVALRTRTAIRQIVYTSFADYLPSALKTAKLVPTAEVTPADDLYPWCTLLEKQTPLKEIASLSMNDMAMLQYTGGTTGLAKGAMLTHGNLSRQLQQVDAWFPVFNREQDEVMLGALPFFHVMGLTTSMNYSLYLAWSNVLIPKPQPDHLIDTIARFKPGFVSMVPTMYIGILRHPKVDELDLSCIKGCFSGSAPLPVEVINEFRSRTGTTISEGFGLSETCPVTHINPYSGKTKIGSIGLPLPDTECRLVDLVDGVSDVPLGEAGELIVKGPQVMAGYWNRPEETAATLRDGWLYTGDIATMDSEGYFYIVDRKKDMIISGGYNVYPREIDEVFFTHPKVAEACAVGVPHPTRGEQIKVFAVLKSGETATEAEMIHFCRERLAAYKLPTMVTFCEELPKSTVGKVLRKDLRQMATNDL
ncbi:long-chain-fatty-acid--CoA ligase [Desulfopila aestuarii]|uniref:Long-chain acyl-CoA synthetase n=1 Tax=Desulfopila aestuarii DSM 18488 TaxID=1121416 RepID=A0A1M7Y666_9BACT|nr:long-chain fatty acid--CoA ligase [Desulfopila aestuarii]SHO48155.1 long-chain acyl-CoA synthetase [Desulfopila aestuarii DSM 18488]